MKRSAVPTFEGPGSIPEAITDEFLATLRRAGVIEAKVFGSTTSGESRPDSDIDLLVSFDRPVTLFQRIDLAAELSRIAGRHVDLMTSIRPEFEPYITPTLVNLPL